jgi:hypothetical protein
MLDPLAQQVGIGGAVAVILVATVMKFLPAFMAALKAQNGKNGKHASGQLSPEEWEGRMRRLHEESEQRIMNNVRSLMDSRNEKVREIIRDEIERLK